MGAWFFAVAHEAVPGLVEIDEVGPFASRGHALASLDCEGAPAWSVAPYERAAADE